MRISATLAYRLLDKIAAATGFMDIALRADEREKKNQCIEQSMNAMRAAAKLISDNTYRPEHGSETQ